MSRLSLFIISSLLLTACSHILQRQTCVELAQDVSYCLAPVAEHIAAPRTAGLETSAISVTQKVSIETQDSQHELLSQLELDQQQLTLVGLAPLGQALFTLTYDDQTLVSEQSQLLGDQFQAEYLLAIMQLIYWPDASVNRHLQGAQIQPYKCDAPLCRGLFFTGNDVDNSSNNSSNNSANNSANNSSNNSSNNSANNSLYLSQPIIEIRYSSLDEWQAQVELSIKAANFKLAISPI
ncbi:DUF3261 domain-containing protein [uncultured Shewanella sp.]|uniref:DUF3261 domain-containing protein n=1 Tax=uncultured Shewanella sp. TaxID=173975 RepID=UPI0026294F2C|nr:DUF3261 domain-containing protein [uncultured Shewanella sp.]